MADVDNIKVAEQFNKLFSERRVLAAAVTREMRNQLELATQIATIVGGMKPEEIGEKLAGASKAMQDFKDKSEEAGSQAEKAMAAVGNSTKGAGKGISDADKRMKLLTTKFPALKSASAGALNGLVQGFKNVVAVGSSAIGMTAGFTSGVFKIGKSIAAIPLKIFRGLIDMATDFPVDSAFLQALENLRKESGDFKTDVSKNVLGAFKGAQAGITGTGLSTFRVLGTFAQQLEHFSAVAKAAGPQFHEFGTAIAADAGTFVGLQKGLGIADDQIKSMLDRAKIFGTSWQTQFLKIANYSLQMGEAFGMSQKLLAKDVAAMVKDVKHFGSITQKEMTIASVYTRKLGIEIKNLTGMMDAFDTFEDAATNSAMLSQAFGTSVDAFKMMSAQNPADQLDMLRKSMAAAGKTSENMSRQELKLLANTTHLDEATAQLAFSTKNQGISLDQIKKKAGDAENAPLRQAEAMEKLAASIERVVMTGQMFKGGFVEQFLHGFQIGIKSSPAFVEMILTLRNALQQTMYMGVRVGKAFINLFPGATPMLKSITHSFDGFNKVLSGIEASFKILFVTADVKGFVANLQSTFGGFFNGSGASGISEGAKTFFKQLAKMFANGLTFVVEELTKGLHRIGAFIKAYVKDPKTLTAAFASGADGAKSGFMKIIEPLVELVKNPVIWKDLWSGITDAFGGVWQLVKKWVTSPAFLKIVAPIAMGMFGMLMAPSLIRGATGALASTLVKSFVNTGSVAADGALAAAAKMGATSPVGPKMMTSLFGNPYVAGAAFLIAAGVAGVGFSKGIEKFQDKLIKDTSAVGGKAEKQIGASLAGIVQLLSFGTITDEAAFGMAKSFAKFTDKLFKQVEDIFGPNLGKTMKARLMIQFDFLTHLGDLIRNVLAGNGEGVAKSIGNILLDAVKMGINSLQMLFIDLPTQLINWLMPAMDKLADFLFLALDSSGGDTSVWTKVKPILSKIGGDLLPPLWESFKAMFTAMFIKLPGVLGKLCLALGAWLLVSLGELVQDISKGMWNLLMEALMAIPGALIKYFAPSLMASFEKIKGMMKFGKEKVQPPTPEQVTNDAAKKNKEQPGSTNVPAPPVVKIPDTTDQSEKLMKAQQTLDGMKAMQELQKMDINKTIADTSAKLNGINMDQINTGLLNRVTELNATMTKLSDGLKTSGSDIEARLAPTIKATQDIIQSVKELDNILASGDATRISVSKNLSKFAKNAGLGGNDKYTITNKGIQINLDLKIVMNAEELEEALVLRTKSIIKEAIKSSMPDMSSDDAIRNRIRNGRS